MMNSYFNVWDYDSPDQYNSPSLQWCFHCPSSTNWVPSNVPIEFPWASFPHPFQQPLFPVPPPPPNPTFQPGVLEKISTSIKTIQDSVIEMQERNSRLLSTFGHMGSVLQEMQLDSTSIDTPEISDATTITSVLESTSDDSNTEVADIVKSHLDAELPVLGVGDTIPTYIFPGVLSSASIDATELEFSPLYFSVKGPLVFDCKMFDRVPKRDISAEFICPSAPIGSLPPVLRINDCKWVDTGQLSNSFDIRQYNQIKLLGKKFHSGRLLVGLIGVYLKDYYLLAICCYLTNWIETGQEFQDASGGAPLLVNPLSSPSDAPKLFDKIAKRSRCFAMLYDSEYIGEVEVLIECSDNLSSFCNSYKLRGISLENSFLYSLDRTATSSVERYVIDQFRHVEVDCKRTISVERYILETANNLSGNFRSYICPLSDSMARAAILSLLIELCSSEQVEPGLPLLLPFDFGCKIGNFAWQINLELVISQPAGILEWIGCAASLEGWTSLSPQQEQVEGILMLVGQIEGLSDYDYDSWVVYVPNGEFLSSIGPIDLKYWERYIGPDSVKEWRKLLDAILPMLAAIVTLSPLSIRMTYGAYIVACCAESEILKVKVLHDEIVVQEIKSNIVLCTNQIHEFCNECTPLEASFLLGAGRTCLEVTTYTNLSTPAAYNLIATLGVEQLCDRVMKDVGTGGAVYEPYNDQLWRKPLEATGQIILWVFLVHTLTLRYQYICEPVQTSKLDRITSQNRELLFNTISAHDSVNWCMRAILVEYMDKNDLVLSPELDEHVLPVPSPKSYISNMLKFLLVQFDPYADAAEEAQQGCTIDNLWHIALSYLEKTWVQLSWILNDAFLRISSKLVLQVTIPWIAEILYVLMPPIQTALDVVFNVCPLVLPSSLSKEHLGDFVVRCGCILWFEKQKEGSVMEVPLDNEAFEEFFWVVNTDKEEHNNTVVSLRL